MAACMLESTFIHCPGIGAKSERKLWQAGARNWSELIARQETLRLSRLQRECLVPLVEESIVRLSERDYRWFARAIPQREHWRAYPSFGSRIGYLDIETNGGLDASSLTVAGLYDGYRLRQFVRGDNLHEFPEYMEQFTMLVTFFGTGFDLPFLRRAFHMEFPQLHVDLCFVLKRLGYSGGLKQVEKRFGLKRSDEIDGMSGAGAVQLWYDYRRGNDDALRVLLDYNAQDVLNLEVLLDAAFPRMLEKVQWIGDESAAASTASAKVG